MVRFVGRRVVVGVRVIGARWVLRVELRRTVVRCVERGARNVFVLRFTRGVALGIDGVRVRYDGLRLGLVRTRGVDRRALGR